MPYLLHDYQMTLFAPTNHPRMECEKTQINNTFESILDEDVPYSIVVKTIPAEETRDIYVQSLCSGFFLFFVYYIFNLQYPKKLEAAFFY